MNLGSISATIPRTVTTRRPRSPAVITSGSSARSEAPPALQLVTVPREIQDVPRFPAVLAGGAGTGLGTDDPVPRAPSPENLPQPEGDFLLRQ